MQNPLLPARQDIRFALRTLAKSPSTTAVAVLTLALGIGASSAVFTIVNSIVLRPLAFRDPDRLVMLWDTQPLVSTAPTSVGHFVEWQTRSRSFTAMAGVANARFTLTGAGEPEQIPGASVTANLFDLLGVAPRLGRTFSPEENQPGRSQVVILTTGLWRRRFGADPSLVGKTIQLGGVPYTVVGILPESFRWARRNTDLWVPLALDPALLHNHAVHFMQAIGRLQTGVTPAQAQAQAQAEMSTIARQIATQVPSASGHGIKLEPLADRIVGDTRPILFVMLGATGFVLLISCANVASLLLAKAAVRRKEIAIRIALGATRVRIIGQLLTESLLLAALGGSLGCVLAVWWVRLLKTLAPACTPRLEEVAIDLRAVIFTLAITALTSVLFGLAPAMQLSGSTRIHACVRFAPRLRSLLIAAEVALSLMLLIGAGLLTRSLFLLHQSDPGFSPERVIGMQLQLPSSRYKDPYRQAALFEQLLVNTESLPGLDAAGLVNDLPLSGGSTNGRFEIEAHPDWAKGREPSTEYRVASPEYFRSLGIRLVCGRYFVAQDAAGKLPVILINETMAKRNWPGENPLGRRMRLKWTDQEPWRTIVGVVADVKADGLNAAPLAESYVPFLQHPVPAMTLTIRYTGEPAAFIDAVRSQIRLLDRDLPVTDVKFMTRIVSDSVAPRTFATGLLSAFALLAVVLAAFGIYGLIAYVVSQSAHDIGLRMALGAGMVNVLRQILGEVMQWVLGGIGVGLIGALALTRVLSQFLYGVQAIDVLTFGGVAALMIGIALAACIGPARRATRIDPLVALRQQ
jgi:putative ABC transport system permease protein